MFGKIKDKLKNAFSSAQEVIEEDLEKKDETIQEELPEKEADFDKKEVEETTEEIEPEVKKKGWFSKVFGSKKEETEQQDLEEIEDEIEKDSEILHNGSIEENKQELEIELEKEEDLSKELEEEIEQKEEKIENKQGFFSKTFGSLASKKITDGDFDKIWLQLELFLLEINIAYEIVEKIESNLKEQLIGNSFNRFKLSTKIQQVLEEEVSNVLSLREGNFIDELKEKIKQQKTPVKIIILGVNGTGKTTSIAKLINFFKKNNISLVVAAADTFRAAAVEQLAEHCQRLETKVIKHSSGSDPAAVAFDAIEHAKSKNLDVVLIDTAGRMPNNPNLMAELQKIKRVCSTDYTIFIGDSISGNDLLDQIELFNQGLEIDGVILTKIDTDERPGSIVTTAYHIEKPIYFLGTGQDYDDLIVFNAKEVSKKLFSIEEDDEE